MRDPNALSPGEFADGRLSDIWWAILRFIKRYIVLCTIVSVVFVAWHAYTCAQLPGAPWMPAAEQLGRFGWIYSGEPMKAKHPEFEGKMPYNRIEVTILSGTTVAEANRALRSANLRIVGATPRYGVLYVDVWWAKDDFVAIEEAIVAINRHRGVNARIAGSKWAPPRSHLSEEVQF